MEKHTFATKITVSAASALVALLTVSSAMPCFADIVDANGNTIETITSGDFECSVMVDTENEGKYGICIEKYLGNATDVVIPDEIDDKEVIAFGDSAFAGNYTLKSVTLPVNLIGLGDFAFAECTALEKFITYEESIFFEAKDGVLYTKDGKTLVRYPLTKVQPDMVIEEGIEQIGSSAFAYSRVLETISLPKTIKSIGAAAFSDCVSLEEFEIPSSVTEISNFTFYRCVQLKKVNIPYGVTRIGDGAFSATALTEIQIPETCKSIGQAAFAATKMNSVTIPITVETIGSSAFGYNIDSSNNLYQRDDFVIYGSLGTAAATYAKDVEDGNHFEFISNGEVVTTVAEPDESSESDETKTVLTDADSNSTTAEGAADVTTAAAAPAEKKKDSVLGENKGLIIGVIAGGVVVLTGIIIAIVKVLRGGKESK